MKKLFKAHGKPTPVQSPVISAYDDPAQLAAATAYNDAQAAAGIGSPLANYVTAGPGAAVVPPSPDLSLTSHRPSHHQPYTPSTQLQQQNHRSYRNSKIFPVSSDENWEVVQPYDYQPQPESATPANLSRDRKTSASALPNPYQPVSPPARSSSLTLGSLPPGASPPVPSPLLAPRSNSPFGVAAPSQAVPPTNPPSQYNMLRKKSRDPNRDSSKDSSTPSSGFVGNTASILRALDSSALSQQTPPTIKQRPSADYTQVLDRPAPFESPQRTPLSDTEFEVERDSLELERERKWRERDMEIHASEKGRGPEKDKPGVLRKGKHDDSDAREPDREKEGRNLLERLQLQPEGDVKRKGEALHERTHAREHDPVKQMDRTGKDDRKLQWTALFSSAKDKEKSKAREKELEKEEQQADQLTRMIGFFTAVATLDWTMALDICERTSANENSAKLAAKALRRELKYGETIGQISAARLWAIMLQNSSDAFITQTSSRKFLDTLEDLITSSRTPTSVKERLVDVLGAAVFISTARGIKDGSAKDAYRALWRKVKPDNKPDEGLPLNTDDAMFASTPVLLPLPNGLQRPQYTYSQNGSDSTFDDSVGDARDRQPVRERRSSRSGIIPVEEDIRRLFQECKIGRGNAQLLSEALAFAGPEDLREKDIIKEFYAKCRASQELIFVQIPWASAGAEHSRARALVERKSGVKGNLSGDIPSTREEKLLAELLKANEELTDALRIYDDIERIGVEKEYEREAKARSQTEIMTDGQGDTTNVGTVFLRAPSTVPSSSSRSPSPTERLASDSPRPPEYLRQPENHIASYVATPLTLHQDIHSAFVAASNTSSVHLLPSVAPSPGRSLLGPRSPANIGARSRSPSPARSLAASRPASRDHSRNSSLDVESDAGIGRPVNHVHGVHDSVLPAPRQEPGVLDNLTQRVEISEKAAGKRKALEAERDKDIAQADGRDIQEQEHTDLPALAQLPFDTGDVATNYVLYPECWKSEPHYVYDAAAERTRERIRDGLIPGA